MFPKDVLTGVANPRAAQALVDLASVRLDAGNLRGAASTCIKALGVYAKEVRAWILLARVHAEYGDFVRAKGFLDVAIREAKKRGVRDLDPWQREIEAVRQQLRQGNNRDDRCHPRKRHP